MKLVLNTFYVITVIASSWIIVGLIGYGVYEVGSFILAFLTDNFKEAVARSF